jgi:hypothetical protein
LKKNLKKLRFEEICKAISTEAQIVAKKQNEVYKNMYVEATQDVPTKG